jgi:hypothetical protein
MKSFGSRIGVVATAAAGIIAMAVQADFTGFVVSRGSATSGGQSLAVYTVFARFNGPTDTLVSCAGFGAAPGTGTTLTGFWHKDLQSQNQGVLSQQFGTWNPAQTGSVTANRPFDSYLTIGAIAVSSNTTVATAEWTSGGNADSRGWNRPDLPDNGALGWRNSSSTNTQGRVYTSSNGPVDVRVGQFVLSQGHAPKVLVCTVNYNDGSPGAPLVSATGRMHLGCAWFRDLDGDGIGFSADGVVVDCAVQPAGHVAEDGDNCPSIANPEQPDCNQNGIGDACDIASGLSTDCDSDGVPDECEGASRVNRIGPFVAIGGSTAAQWFVDGLLPAFGRPPKLIVEARADLGAASDGLIVTVDGATVGTVFLTDGSDCPAALDVATIALPVQDFNAFAADGVITVRATAFGAVSSASCTGGGMRFRLIYDGLLPGSDCNGNGQLDSCEVGTGAVADCNQSGIPDVCELANGSVPNCNGNALPDFCDIASGVSTDLNGNGVPDECELVVGGTGYATIQAAVEAAPSGATVFVGPGTYSGTIVLDEKRLAIVSTAGASETIWSGVGAASSMVLIRGAAAAGSRIEGFTFRDGSAGTAEFGLRLGGAMCLLSTTADIVRCRFVNNSTEYGGGIYGYDFSGSIEDCVFEDNTAQFNSGGVQLGFGGTCSFTRNRLLRNHAGDGGGGMHVVNWFEGPVTLVWIDSCEFIDNTAVNQGGALLWYGNQGQGLVVSSTRVAGNTASDAAFTRVGGELPFVMGAVRFCRNTPVDVIGSIEDLGANMLSIDCDGDGICDGDEIAAESGTDCDGNGLLDSCDFAAGTTRDCNGNGRFDSCDIADGPFFDCDGNGLVDSCEIAAGTARDCNGNGRVDFCDIASGSSTDFDHNGIPDECSPDCDGDGLPDAFEIAVGLARDCDRDSVPDNCEIAQDASKDKNHNGRLDACELARGDTNLDGVVNSADLTVLLSLWGTTNPPVGDLDGDGQINAFDVTILLTNWGPTP